MLHVNNMQDVHVIMSVRSLHHGFSTPGIVPKTTNHRFHACQPVDDALACQNSKFGIGKSIPPQLMLREHTLFNGKPTQHPNWVTFHAKYWMHQSI